MLRLDHSKPIRLVCISDTHGRKLGPGGIEIPEGDILIHAGDLTEVGTLPQVGAVLENLAALPHRYKVFIAGNHDWAFAKTPTLCRDMVRRYPGLFYLEDSGIQIGDFSLYGSPWQPWFYDWAFNGPRAGSLRDRWDQIPAGTDILITHGPARGHADYIPYQDAHVGCPDLLSRIEEIQPRLHVCGHIHEGYGASQIGKTLTVNASILDGNYSIRNQPFVVDLDPIAGHSIRCKELRTGRPTGGEEDCPDADCPWAK